MALRQVKELIKKKGRSILTESESKDLLAKAGMPVVETRVAGNKEEAVVISREIGFPVAIKINSPDIVHKSDIGGVKLGLATSAAVERAYDQIMATVEMRVPTARIHGVTVQKMAPSGIETIIGVAKDLTFGHVVMFGLGGVFVEVLKDVAFRIIPVTKMDVNEMIEERKGYPLLHGYRGHEPANIDALAQLILNISDFVHTNPQVKEIDLNPVIACADQVIVVDARILF